MQSDIWECGKKSTQRQGKINFFYFTHNTPEIQAALQTQYKFLEVPSHFMVKANIANEQNSCSTALIILLSFLHSKLSIVYVIE